MEKENKVLDDLRLVTFEGMDEELAFEVNTTIGTTLDDSIGVLLSANVDASKIILQVGEQRLMFSPETLIYTLRSISMLTSVLIDKGGELLKVIQDVERKKVENVGAMCAYELTDEGWDVKMDETSLAARTIVDAAKAVEMTKEKAQHHSEVLDKLLEPEEAESTSSEEDEDEPRILSAAEKKAKKLDVEGEYEEDHSDDEYLRNKSGEGRDHFDDDDEDDDEDEIFDDEDDMEGDTIPFDGEQVEDAEFLKRMQALEGTLTGVFEVREDEEPTFEKIAEIKAEHGELAAREYVESLTQEQKEGLIRLRMEAKEAAKAKTTSPEEPTREQEQS